MNIIIDIIHVKSLALKPYISTILIYVSYTHDNFTRFGDASNGSDIIVFMIKKKILTSSKQKTKKSNTIYSRKKIVKVVPKYANHLNIYKFSDLKQLPK
jgi:hypothetical protein